MATEGFAADVGGPRGGGEEKISDWVRGVRLAYRWTVRRKPCFALPLLYFYNKITPFGPRPTWMMCHKLTESRVLPPPDSPDRYGRVQMPQTHPMPPNETSCIV